jgi:hypothetical protein
LRALRVADLILEKIEESKVSWERKRLF